MGIVIFRIFASVDSILLDSIVNFIKQQFWLHPCFIYLQIAHHMRCTKSSNFMCSLCIHDFNHLSGSVDVFVVVKHSDYTSESRGSLPSSYQYIIVIVEIMFQNRFSG